MIGILISRIAGYNNNISIFYRHKRLWSKVIFFASIRDYLWGWGGGVGGGEGARVSFPACITGLIQGWGSASRGDLQSASRGICIQGGSTSWGSVSRGFCIQGGLYPGGFCIQGGLHPGGWVDPPIATG